VSAPALPDFTSLNGATRSAGFGRERGGVGLFALLVAGSAVVYIPLALAFNPFS
jgi:hypothetical protein